MPLDPTIGSITLDVAKTVSVTLVDDTSAVQATTKASDADCGALRDSEIPIPAGADVTWVTKTIAFAAGSRAVAVTYFHGNGVENDKCKMRLYMGGVQVAETGFINAGAVVNRILVGLRALTGATECKMAMHNYDGVNPKAVRCYTTLASLNPAGMGIGSIKT